MPETTREVEDVVFLKRCGYWPHWPYCPVQRHKDDRHECGIVRDCEPIGGSINGRCEPIVRILNLWAGWSSQEYAAATTYAYESVEELCVDGWTVD